jgi:hypothetical protein
VNEKDKKLRFTALLHHIYNLETLRMAYFSLKKEAAPGVDRETWRHYGEELERNLQDLCAAVEVLNAIYKTDFLGFSYGFRPGRSQHQALDALYTGLLTRKVNWVLDLDIKSFLDRVPQCSFSIPSGMALASRAVSAQSERSRTLGSYAAPHRSLAATAFRLSSLSPAPHGRYHPRQEPDALCGPPSYVASGL